MVRMDDQGCAEFQISGTRQYCGHNLHINTPLAFAGGGTQATEIPTAK
jgi:hypothetical protein